MMQAGRLDRLVSLQHRTLGAQSASGSYPSATFTEYAKVWAEKRDLTTRERFAADQVQADVTTVFVIRYRADVLPTDQLVCEGRTYNIRPGKEIGRREGLEILASAPVT